MADRTAQAVVKRSAVFVRERRAGKDTFIRRPYDIVEYFWGNAAPVTYLQPHSGREGTIEYVYDDIRTYSVTPDWDVIQPHRTM